MKFDLKYGDGIKVIQIPEDADITVLQPEIVPILKSLPTALNNALENPLNGDALGRQLRKKGHPRIAIAIPDETLATPVGELVSIVLSHIYGSLPGLESGSITIVIGGGLHSPSDNEKQNRLLPPDIVNGCNIVVHDANNFMVTDFGTTSRGTPVRINAATDVVMVTRSALENIEVAGIRHGLRAIWSQRSGSN